MTDFSLFLIAGMGLIAALALWLGRSAKPARATESASRPEGALAALLWELPSPAMTERIFALEDREFVARQVPKLAQQQFLRERKALALSWLRETRLVLRYLMAFHLKAVRSSRELSPAVEARLAVRYVFFLVVYDLLFALIWLRGPFAARSMVGYAAKTAERFWSLCAQVLAGMDPARLSKIQASLPVRHE